MDGELYLYDWCTTKDNCGEHSAVHGYWDKCLYLDSSKPDYLASTWQEKQFQLWEQITSDQEIGEYPEGGATALVKKSVRTSFEDEWDVMPAGRLKYIHSVGGVCPFVVKLADSPYTGLLKSGEVHGLIRMGSAGPFTTDSGLVPGAGIKFLRSGRTSANFVALNQLGPMDTSSYNFFKVPLRNHLPDDLTIPLAIGLKKFCQAQKCPSKVGISDVAKYDQDGNQVEKPIFPFKLTFEPTGEVNFRDEYSELPEFTAQFKDIVAGTNLYTLKAHVSPDDIEGSVVLGQVTTTEACVTSKFGDERLFFQHQSIEEDKSQAPPEWTAGYDAECGNWPIPGHPSIC